MTGLGVALLVVLAGAAGSALRYAVGRALDRDWHHGTLLVNLVGSAVLGGLVGSALPPTLVTVLGTGLCGGLTTYSAFAVQTAGLARARWPQAAAYALVTVGGCLLTATAGWAVASALTGTS